MPNSYKYFDANLFFQGKMDAGHGRLFLAARCLTLPTPPEFHPGPFNLNLFASYQPVEKVFRQGIMVHRRSNYVEEAV